MAAAIDVSGLSIACTVCACATACAVLRVLLRRHGSRSVSSLNDLSSFVQEEVVSQGTGLTVLLGRFTWQPVNDKALVKISPRTQDVTAAVPSMETALSSYSGAEYAYYSGGPSLLSLLSSKSLRPCYSLEVIAPASEKQISRSRPQPGVFVVETAETYRRVVKPYIEALDPAATSWIYKCLDLSKERERVLFNDTDAQTGFLLNVDTKWRSHPPCTEDAAVRRTWQGHEAVRDLYCLAICHRRDVRSLRDLTAAHLPLLRRILKEGVRTVCDVYGVQPHDLRVFVHYQPQFYHFHVHFTRLHSDIGCQVGCRSRSRRRQQQQQQPRQQQPRREERRAPSPAHAPYFDAPHALLSCSPAHRALLSYPTRIRGRAFAGREGPPPAGDYRHPRGGWQRLCAEAVRQGRRHARLDVAMRAERPCLMTSVHPLTGTLLLSRTHHP